MRQDAFEYNVCVEVLYMQIVLKGHCIASVEEIQQKATVGLTAIIKQDFQMSIEQCNTTRASVYVHKDCRLRMIKFEEVFDALMYVSRFTSEDVKFFQRGRKKDNKKWYGNI